MGRSQFFSLSRMARSWHRANLNSNSNSDSIAPLHDKVGAFQEANGVSHPEEATSSKERKRMAEEYHKALAQATIPIETRLDNGERLWDQDFSSMSSYRSHDLELLQSSGKLESFEYGPELEILHLDQPSSSSRSEPSCVNLSHSSCESFNSESQAAHTPDGQAQQRLSNESVSKRSKLRRQRSNESLSAELPSDVSGLAKNSIPLVMQSYDPYGDFRDSIREMVHENGIYEWLELQELLYCYIALNAEEMHEWIRAAFVDVLVELRSDKYENEESYDWP